MADSKDPGAARWESGPEPAQIHVSGDASSVARGLREVSELMAGTDIAGTGTKAVPAKAGYQTTEFWVMVLATIGAVAASATDNLPPRYAAFAAIVSAVAYQISRGLAKL